MHAVTIFVFEDSRASDTQPCVVMLPDTPNPRERLPALAILRLDDELTSNARFITCCDERSIKTASEAGRRAELRLRDEIRRGYDVTYGEGQWAGCWIDMPRQVVQLRALMAVLDARFRKHGAMSPSEYLRKAEAAEARSPGKQMVPVATQTMH